MKPTRSHSYPETLTVPVQESDGIGWPTPCSLPDYEQPHHALPLGRGWWRGPAPGSKEAVAELEALGVRTGNPLADGSRAYAFRRPNLALEELAFTETQSPRGRAHWIAARLHAARRACGRPRLRPQWMAILNLTPDSFSDGGRLQDIDQVAELAARRIEQGAHWLDLGAESTRPGAAAVPAERQLERLLPALEAIRALDPIGSLDARPSPGTRISIDTRSARVARETLAAGADLINDVSGLSADPEMVAVVAENQASVAIMHMRGTPADMQQRTQYRHLLGEVADELALRIARAREHGISADKILIDPGYGFAKDAAQTRSLLARTHALRALGLPILAGPSRKSFMAEILPDRSAAERDGGTAGAAAICVAQGVDILRLHQGASVWDAVKVAFALATQAPESLPSDHGAPPA